MGLSATLYEIKGSNFDLLVDDPSRFRTDMSEQYEIFEKNFEGLSFVLAKCVSKEFEKEIQQIFNPSDFIGESINLEGDIDNFDIDAYLDY